MTATIRRALAADAPALTALMHASAAYAGEYGRILDGYEVTPGQIGRDLVFVAEAGGGIAGFYSLILGAAPELDLMFVDDSAQGIGLGRLLLEHMRAEAAALGIAAVRIVAHPPAAAFYRRMGAVEVGIDPPHDKASWERPVLSLATGAVL